MKETNLPENWRGSWRGEITVTNAREECQTLVMLLHIVPLAESVHSWRIEYITNTQHNIREYELHTVPKEGRGRFVVDEKNGILLDCRLFGTTLFSQFQVQDTLLMSRFENRGDAIAVEIVTFDAALPRRSFVETDDETGKQENDQEVLSYPCRSLQNGILQRIA